MTLCDPIDCSPWGSSVHGISQESHEGIQEWVDISFSRASSRPRDRTHVSGVSWIGKWILSQERYLGSQSLASVQSSSVAHSCPTLCDTMDCSKPGFHVHHQLLKLAQTHVHRVGDAIQPSHPLSPPSPPTFNLSQNQGHSNESVLHIRWPKYWRFSFSISPSNEYSGPISFRIDWFDLLAV